MDYRLTIIMSNYNQVKYMKKALDSIEEQKVNFNYKIIITDDCSTKDESISFIKDYSNNHDNVDVIFSDINTGYLSNILRAKRKSDTDYFCLLDADDYWTDETFLQTAFDFLEKNPEYSIYESNVYVLPIDSDGDEKTRNLKLFISNGKTGTYTKEMFLANKAIPITQTTGMFFRNTIFKYGIPPVMEKAVGTLSERSFEGDVDRFLMHLKTGSAYYSDIPVGVYRLTSGGIWVRLLLSEKYLLNARAYMDYYAYYESHISFFAGKVWNLLIMYFEQKQKEIGKLNSSETLISDNSQENLNELYDFCYKNKDNICRKNYRAPLLRRIKKAIRIVLQKEK